MTESFRREIAVELAKRDMRQRDLARLINVPPTTLSDWLTGAHPSPPDLPERVRNALRRAEVKA